MIIDIDIPSIYCYIRTNRFNYFYCIAQLCKPFLFKDSYWYVIQLYIVDKFECLDIYSTIGCIVCRSRPRQCPIFRDLADYLISISPDLHNKCTRVLATTTAKYKRTKFLVHIWTKKLNEWKGFIANAANKANLFSSICFFFWLIRIPWRYSDYPNSWLMWLMM